jgi:hypothetical protein
VWVPTQQFCGCTHKQTDRQTVLADQFPAITMLKIFVKLQLIMLQYYVMFHLKECIIFAVAVSLTGNLSCKIGSQVNVMLILKEIKQWQTVF